MVGDRLNTDIQFGKNGGLSTLLVLTGASSNTYFSVGLPGSYYNPMAIGITQETEITGPNASPIVPDYVTSSLGDLRIVLSS